MDSNSTNSTFDLIIIGGGPGGYVGAIRAAQLGMKVALIEKSKTLGGTCLNVGCIPSKALLDSSEHYHYAKTKLAKHGVLTESVRLDLEAMIKRKDTLVRQLTQGIDGLIKKNKVTRFWGAGKILKVDGAIKEVSFSPDTANTEHAALTLKAAKIILATGSEPSPLPFLPFDGKRIISSTEALCLQQVPKHLVVIGGGVIGLELGSVWLRLGAKVTVIEFMDKFLPMIDQQMAKEFFSILTKQGMDIKLGTKCLGAKQTADQVHVMTETIVGQKSETFDCDVVLVSAGRRPFTAGLGLEDAGIKKDPQGRVIINAHYETSVAGVYAIGDIVTGPMLAHKAEEEGIAAVEIIAGQAGHVNYNAIPNVIYTWPELATVGLTEEQCKEKGLQIKIGTFPFMANGRAKAMDEIEGTCKIIADARTDKLLGAHILGARASDMIPELVSVIEFGGSAEDVARTCHAHPTLSEIVKEAAMHVGGRRIHL
jgi:dihydrolipoamide dehydrogenase